MSNDNGAIKLMCYYLHTHETVFIDAKKQDPGLLKQELNTNNLVHMFQFL